MTNKIWAILCNMQFKAYYIDFQVTLFQKYDRNINIFLAFASSTSIAAWAIWKEYDMLWAVIIATSQIITVIKPYFPFYKYVKELNLKYTRLVNINVDIEKLWDSYSHNQITNAEASSLYYSLKKDCNEILKFSDDSVFGQSKKIEKKANECTKNYLETNYSVEIKLT